MNASGFYPNQDKGEGLPYYVQKDRPIENTEIVVWHTFGHTHVFKPEDFPIMLVEDVGFTLKPNNFFMGNAAMDVPAEGNNHSVDTVTSSVKSGSSCCSE